MKIQDILNALNQWAPPSYQETYDNATLITGDAAANLTGALITLDCTEAVVDEAIDKKMNLIIAHHPIVFKGLKSFTGRNYVERTVIKAIKNDISIFSIHTNLDHIDTGVNKKICDLIGLQDTKILAPKSNTLTHLVTFVPKSDADSVANALFKAGAGKIGNYSECGFQSNGTGTFLPNEDASPAIGALNKKTSLEETRIEIMFPSHLSAKIVKALKKHHPYEQVAYYLTSLENTNQLVGAGMIGELKEPLPSVLFLKKLKSNFNLPIIRHTKIHKETIQRVAVCGGAGSFLLNQAKANGADVLITGDFKYHEFFDAEEKIIIADIGHYESEVFTKDLICDFLREKFANIALNLSEVDTNPINYF